MHVLAVVGRPDEGRSALVDRVVDALSAHGTVAVVTSEAATPGDATSTDVATPPTLSRYREAGANAAYEFGDEGWVGTGRSGTVADALDDLAPDNDYCVLDGVDDATVPGVVLGDVDYAGPVLGRADEAADVDVAAVHEDLLDRQPHETLESLVERAKASPDADMAGAIATFTGRVRAREHEDDERTTHLEFETYEAVAADRMATIREELTARDGVYEVLLHHRTGVVRAGEDIVFVVVLAGHRAEAFGTVSDGIDRLKDEVPIFKKEATTGEEFWVHERETDAH
ncbi:molybdopterin synthase [Haloarchaeobius sp. HRN-SO-5]|uniref:molybdopterin synthase n=1 Tax=Haloarchaeobius sp. HRN-SO-5 TaxID=3446118 RepID=UPI003EB9BC7C